MKPENFLRATEIRKEINSLNIHEKYLENNTLAHISITGSEHEIQEDELDSDFESHLFIRTAGNYSSIGRQRELELLDFLLPIKIEDLLVVYRMKIHSRIEDLESEFATL